MLTKNEIQELLDKATPGGWEPMDNAVRIGGKLHWVETGNPIPGDSSNDTYLLAAAPILAKMCIELMEENERLDQDTYKAVRALGNIVNEHHVTPDIVSFSKLNLEALEQQRHADYINSLLNKIDRLKIQLNAAKKDRAISESSVY